MTRHDTQGIHENLAAGLSPRWERYVVGAGALESTPSGLRLESSGATSRRYTNAQIDDYQRRPRRRFPWHPPLKLTVHARFSHPVVREESSDGTHLRGTAGFGFWNDPFLMTGARVPTLPRAIWFFHGSPPSDIKLDLDAPGWGWKAATIDALHARAWALAACAPLAVPLMNVRPLYRKLWPPIQRTLNIREAQVTVDATRWHTYCLEWGIEEARFSVDDEPMLTGAPSPRGPLGFVMWLDNQYLVARPWGRFAWGLLQVPQRHWLEVSQFDIEPG
jgi:hypothetical protein